MSNIQQKTITNYAANTLVVWGVIVFYRLGNYYSNFISNDVQTFLIYIGLLLSLLSIPSAYQSAKKGTKSKGLVLLNALIKLFKSIFRFSKSYDFITGWTKEEKKILLFALVKIFFIPIMLNFVFSNFWSVWFKSGDLYQFVSDAYFNGSELSFSRIFNILIYPILLSAFFLIDTIFFAFGYLFEADFLKNKVKSVEPTVLGWVVALICYPPFVGLANNIAPWATNDYNYFENTYATIVLRIVVAVLLAIYVWATISLGAKCSNLTNRGIVKKGAYSWVRHPAYISKNLIWWLTFLPVMTNNYWAIVSMLFWSFIYYLRALTEERHLISDVDYQDYCEKVKYRFVPGVY